MKNEMTVWSFPYRKSYYLTHPWKWFGQIKRNLNAAYKRTTKGYCFWDWADLDSWFVTIMPDMLRDMAIHGSAYPGVEPFETPEKWHSWLHRMADQLTTCQDEDNGNEYYKPYIESLTANPKLIKNETEEMKNLREKYCTRSLEIKKDHDELFKSTMEELVKHWDCLWD